VIRSREGFMPVYLREEVRLLPATFGQQDWAGERLCNMKMIQRGTIQYSYRQLLDWASSFPDLEFRIPCSPKDFHSHSLFKYAKQSKISKAHTRA